MKKKKYILSEEQKAQNKIYKAKWYQDNKEEKKRQSLEWYKNNPNSALKDCYTEEYMGTVEWVCVTANNHSWVLINGKLFLHPIEKDDMNVENHFDR